LCLLIRQFAFYNKFACIADVYVQNLLGPRRALQN
jgi:hypothetical protein